MFEFDCDLGQTTNKISTCGGLAQLVECALCKREAPGSKPGFSTSVWSYSVMVITLDFESSDPGSNPGRTFFLSGDNKVRQKEGCEVFCSRTGL